MRVLISSCSSFWLSRAAVLRARELDASWAFPDHMAIKGEPECWCEGDPEELYSLPSEVPRHDPVLLQVYDELGPDAMAGYPNEQICEVHVPDDVTYYVASYIGEWIAEEHRQWSRHGSYEGESAGAPYTFTKDSKFSPTSA